MILWKQLSHFEKSGLLIKRVSKAIKNEAEEQKEKFLGILLDTLGASVLWNLLTGKGAIATSQGREANMPGQDTIRASEGTFWASEGTVRAS